MLNQTLTFSETRTDMTIALPGSSKKGIGGLFGRKAKVEKKAPTAQKQLSRQDVAKMFSAKPEPREVVKPARLNRLEREDRAELGSLRGALYSED
ncbi:MULTISPECIES: hypothetical protein [Rhodobacterales]|uniref:hypothetical protein n=1 Tax=Rhodobacterales TaxID=204455 RepID=UPI0015EFF24C|nr:MULTISPECIES: hypothetical protein [Rhodobacterales]MDO6590750.1 hypothetical protein [Yoonia sp. 1_MG-2023]